MTDREREMMFESMWRVIGACWRNMDKFEKGRQAEVEMILLLIEGQIAEAIDRFQYGYEAAEERLEDLIWDLYVHSPEMRANEERILARWPFAACYYERIRKGRVAECWSRYEDYLKSSEWKTKRESALERAGNRCEICCNACNLNVHHKTYRHLGDELPIELIVLCQACHGKFHGRLAKPLEVRHGRM